jgi:hypothetical protein
MSSCIYSGPHEAQCLHTLIQTIVKHGTDVPTPIQTVIQTVVKHGTDVQTVELLKLFNLELLNSNSLYVCTMFHNRLYNGLYGGRYVCTMIHNRLYSDS